MDTQTVIVVITVFIAISYFLGAVYVKVQSFSKENRDCGKDCGCDSKINQKQSQIRKN